MNINNLLSTVFVDTKITIEIGIEENNTYYTKIDWVGTANNVPEKYHNMEIFLTIPMDKGEIKIITH